MILILIILLIIFAIICTLYIIINIKTKNFELHDIKINGGNMNEVDILTNEAI
jgi:hypothetical protein